MAGAPELAQLGMARLNSAGVALLGTLRRDGADAPSDSNSRSRWPARRSRPTAIRQPWPWPGLA